ncbi:ribulose-phosphate 3-epimerase [Helicobacter pylori]
MKIAASVLSANFLKLQEEVFKAVEAGADLLHIDVMDGHFVPNLTFGPMIIEQIANISSIPLDIHLMVDRVPFFLELFTSLKPKYLGFHLEAESHIHRHISFIRSKEISPCIALNPHTSVHELKYILPDLDMVLLMSVNPGFGGQKFIPHTIEKVRELRDLRDEFAPHCLIEVDGGINHTNAPMLARAGVDILVAGSYIFGSDDYNQAISSLKKSVN